MTPNAFAQQGFGVLRAIVVEPLLGSLWRHVLERDTAGTFATDPEWPGTPVAYGDVVMEHMLERLMPAIEAATGLALFPTYSYLRLYKRGDALRPHRDRPACEISVSLNVGQEPAIEWPLWLRVEDGPRAVMLTPGDAVVYRGVDVEHWREPYDGVRAAQVFLHYVDRNGPHAEWRFDKRERLGLAVPPT